MSFLSQVFSRYRHIERHIRFLILAEFFLQMINSSFFLLFNYHMVANGYEDYEVAETIAVRFTMVLLLAVPLGFFLKRLKIKPFFLVAAIMVPFISLLTIYAVYHQMDWLLNLGMLGWGACFACIQVAGLPFILLYAKKETHSEAISLFFLTWSIAIFIAGMFNYLLSWFNPDFFDEGIVLAIYSLVGWIAVIMVLNIRVEERPVPSESFEWKSLREDYDWGLIFKASMPTLIIAVGAGFTIPVINLFFLNVHGVESDAFSVYGSLTYLIVAIGMTFMPYIKRRFGYQTAITLFQSLAVIALFTMATTEYYNGWKYAIYIAVFFYIIRQPLMNVAGPMTSELTMYYVGEKNQEMISALNASIWSGSWLFSMTMFSQMRQWGLRYVSIFLITVGLYVIGVLWYAYLIREYRRRTGSDGKSLPKEAELELVE
jgi:MFS family permease